MKYLPYYQWEWKRHIILVLVLELFFLFVESLQYKHYNNIIKMKKITKIMPLFLFLLIFGNQKILAEEKIQIGLLVPLSGINSEIGHSIVKSVRLAINKIDNKLIEIIPKDTASNPVISFRSFSKSLNSVAYPFI